MNKVMICGRLTRDPDVRYSQGAEPMAIARYTIAVNRRNSNKAKEGEQTADFIGCVAFGRPAEFARDYLKKGIKMNITGRIQTGSYVNKAGVKVYTTEVVIEEQEFAESKNASSGGSTPPAATATAPVVNMPAKPSSSSGVIPIDDVMDELQFTA